MTDTERRRLLATADFHDKMARAFRQVGKVGDAESADHAAKTCREQAEPQ